MPKISSKWFEFTEISFFFSVNTYIASSITPKFEPQDYEDYSEPKRKRPRKSKQYFYDDYEYYTDNFEDRPKKNKTIILKIRIANQPDPDFIEMDLPRKKLTYTGVIAAMCDELDVQVKKGKNCYSAQKTSNYTQCENFKNFTRSQILREIGFGLYFQDLGCVVL